MYNNRSTSKQVLEQSALEKSFSAGIKKFPCKGQGQNKQ